MLFFIHHIPIIFVLKSVWLPDVYMMKGSYKSLEGEAEAMIKVKGSKFIGYSRSVQTHEDTEIFLTNIKSLHPKARHHCFAWRLGNPVREERANDDGEPSGTAGRPILGQLIKADVTDAMIVVVRYFGGTLLGTSGLIQAYKECAEAVLQEARIVVIVETETWKIALGFEIVHVLEEWAPKIGFTILERDHHNDKMHYTLEIPAAESYEARKILFSKLDDIYPEEVDLDQKAFNLFEVLD